MELAADLHLHSRYSGGVSPAMTLAAIAAWSQRKGLDLIATGDCLQEDYLKEIERSLEPAEPGLFRLNPECAEGVARSLPSNLRRPLRFVLSTEVHCSPSGTPPLGGIHHLIYFPTMESARRLRSQLEDIADLRDGRPLLQLNSRQILELVLRQNDGLKFAPAHLFNPWYSSLGTVSGTRSLAELFGELTPQLFAVEMGLTSIPAMCRRMSTLDRHALFCGSDAHSLENLGREYLRLEIEPSFEGLFAALRTAAHPGRRGMVKYPLARARYFPNWCGICQRPDFGEKCPKCGRPLVAGSRDRLEAIADRSEPLALGHEIPCQQLLPLAALVADFTNSNFKRKSVTRDCTRLFEALGNERHILTQASQAEIAAASIPEVARRILEQRVSASDSKSAPVNSSAKPAAKAQADQLSFGLF